MVPELLSETDKFFCHFGPFFALLPPNDPQNQNFAPNNPKNQNFKTMKKLPQIMITWRTVSKIWCMADRQTIEETEKVTYRHEWGREYGIPLFV